MCNLIVSIDKVPTADCYKRVAVQEVLETSTVLQGNGMLPVCAQTHEVIQYWLFHLSWQASRNLVPMDGPISMEKHFQELGKRKTFRRCLTDASFWSYAQRPHLECY